MVYRTARSPIAAVLQAIQERHYHECTVGAKTKQQRLEDSVQNAKDRLAKARADLNRKEGRLNAERRKRDTRWKILVGAVVLANAEKDPDDRKTLDALLDSGLTEGRDRALLDEWRGSNRTETSTEETPPEPPQEGESTGGWKPCRIGNEWGAALSGSAVAGLPKDPTGTRIKVTDSKGVFWHTTITKVVTRSENRVVVRNTGRPA